MLLKPMRPGYFSQMNSLGHRLIVNTLELYCGLAFWSDAGISGNLGMR